MLSKYLLLSNLSCVSNKHFYILQFFIITETESGGVYEIPADDFFVNIMRTYQQLYASINFETMD